MPNRFIKESCRSSASLAALSDKAERLFWRLVTVADDFGRFEADPEVVQSECFKRLDNRPSLADVSKCLQMLANASMVKLFTNGTDRQYGCFVNWAKFQGPPRARSSKFPDLGSSDDSASRCKQMLANASVSESESESESDSSSSSSVQKPQKSQKARSVSAKPTASPISDAEWLLTLKKNPAYAGIDVEIQLGKLDAWLSTRPHLKKTRRRIVNWLNRVEKSVLLDGRRGGVER